MSPHSLTEKEVIYTIQDLNFHTYESWEYMMKIRHKKAYSRKFKPRERIFRTLQNTKTHT
jgi:hypothetical protein